MNKHLSFTLGLLAVMAFGASLAIASLAASAAADSSIPWSPVVSSANAAVGDKACNPFNCFYGCCDANGACQPGNTDNSCGNGGQQCADCGASGGYCDGRQQCNAGRPCRQGRCQTGCCDANRQCHTGGEDGYCGGGGQACVNCAGEGESCQNQQCVATGCNPKTCPNGCCDPNSQKCMPGNTPDACGAGGTTCIACPQGDQCQSGKCTPGDDDDDDNDDANPDCTIVADGIADTCKYSYYDLTGKALDSTTLVTWCDACEALFGKSLSSPFFNCAESCVIASPACQTACFGACQRPGDPGGTGCPHTVHVIYGCELAFPLTGLPNLYVPELDEEKLCLSDTTHPWACYAQCAAKYPCSNPPTQAEATAMMNCLSACGGPVDDDDDSVDDDTAPTDDDVSPTDDDVSPAGPGAAKSSTGCGC